MMSVGMVTHVAFKLSALVSVWDDRAGRLGKPAAVGSMDGIRITKANMSVTLGGGRMTRREPSTGQAMVEANRTHQASPLNDSAPSVRRVESGNWVFRSGFAVLNGGGRRRMGMASTGPMSSSNIRRDAVGDGLQVEADGLSQALGRMRRAQKKSGAARLGEARPVVNWPRVSGRAAQPSAGRGAEGEISEDFAADREAAFSGVPPGWYAATQTASDGPSHITT
ncbi:hypothetical protein CCHR01_19385 [Colletotrichum chrysophilum]|uniref:Uncharacterized protein n=1 Tax=Colletotrichum chrysophilum TaxID=1836956 RepID=A0AAD9EAG6_9PEZI|nr:hypothetical protein CCHR01_19385 [Colletotrichum chrysophilum]